MAIRTGEFYQHKPEVWDKAKCERMAKRTAKDGLGTPYPFKGYIFQPSPLGWGKIKYNGGCVREGDWWEGEDFPLPEVAEGFEIVNVPTWGFRIVKTSDIERAQQ